MIDAIVTKVKGFLLNPVETFQQSKNDEPKIVFTYFGLLLLLHAILAALIAAIGIEKISMHAGVPGGMALPVAVFLMALVGGFIVTLIFAAWLHLWVYLLGGRKGIMQTINAIIYSHTPRLLLGWIPFVGFIFMLWSLALAILGIRELQEISTIKAILAVAIAVMIPLILLIILAAWFMVSYMTVNGIPVPPTNAIN
ncbi:MAG: Yip1 family protein [Methanoregula sp.]|nr:Yip1 family protein [Methanoregula sp.]